MLLTLKDPHHAVLAGKFKKPHTKRSLAAALVAEGVGVSNTVSTKTTFVVIGEGIYGKMNAELDATQRGLPVLNQAQVLTLVKKGILKLEDDAPPEQNLEELIGEARSILAGTPDSKMWRSLVKLLDQCVPEQSEPLVHYLSANMAHWNLPENVRYEESEEEGSYFRNWVGKTPFGYLRVMPRSWITEVITGSNLPKHSLVKAVVLEELGLRNKEKIKLFEATNLNQVTFLDLGDSKHKLSMTALKTLAASPLAKSVKHLRVTMFNDTLAKALDGQGRLDLECLQVSYDRSNYTEDALHKLWHSEWTSNLTHLFIECSYWGTQTTFFKTYPKKDLSKITLHIDRSIRWVAPWIQCLPDVSTLRWVGVLNDTGYFRAKYSNELLDTPLPKVSYLDLSSLLFEYAETEQTWLREKFFNKLPTSKLCSGLDSINLGIWHTSQLARRLQDAGIKVIQDSP